MDNDLVDSLDCNDEERVDTKIGENFSLLEIVTLIKEKDQANSN